MKIAPLMSNYAQNLTTQKQQNKNAKTMLSASSVDMFEKQTPVFKGNIPQAAFKTIRDNFTALLDGWAAVINKLNDEAYETVLKDNILKGELKTLKEKAEPVRHILFDVLGLPRIEDNIGISSVIQAPPSKEALEEIAQKANEVDLNRKKVVELGVKIINARHEYDRTKLNALRALDKTTSYDNFEKIISESRQKSLEALRAALMGDGNNSKSLSDFVERMRRPFDAASLPSVQPNIT